MSSNETNLDDLLDGALDDFDKIPQQKLIDSSVKGRKDQFESIEENLKEFSEESDEKIREKLRQTINQLHGNSTSSGLEQDLTEEELNKMFNSFDLGGPGGPDGESFTNLLPMMEGMMQSLMSKELLYPPMRDIADKFPGWLADNRNKISSSLYENYNKQYDLTKQICFIFESEEETDSQTKRKENFEIVMRKMQEMQTLGHPPKELTGDNSPGFQFDAGGNPIFPDGMNPDQCCLQ